MNVKVHNLNVHPYSEEFKGIDINIEPGGYYEMDYYEAKMFLGKMGTPPKKLANGLFDPKSFKKLKIDEEDELRAKNELYALESSDSVEKVFVCQGCTKEFRTKNGLLKHIKDKHQAQMEKDARDELLDNEDLD
jgi:hypothetical protein